MESVDLKRGMGGEEFKQSYTPNISYHFMLSIQLLFNKVDLLYGRGEDPS